MVCYIYYQFHLTLKCTKLYRRKLQLLWTTNIQVKGEYLVTVTGHDLSVANYAVSTHSGPCPGTIDKLRYLYLCVTKTHVA
jgi:hypothetical protein